MENIFPVQLWDHGNYYSYNISSLQAVTASDRHSIIINGHGLGHYRALFGLIGIQITLYQIVSSVPACIKVQAKLHKAQGNSSYSWKALLEIIFQTIVTFHSYKI